MAQSAIFLTTILFVGLVTSQPTQSSTTATQKPESFDASAGGESGNPGGQLRFSAKALDEVYKHAIEMIAQSLKKMVIPDVIVPVGNGMLAIKNTRVTEAKIGKYDRQMVPPNRVRSQLSDGRLTSVGEWQFKPMGATRSIAQGIFRTVVVDADLNITNQLSRSWDAKPMVQTTECKAFLGRFHVQIEGFGDNTTTIDECSNLLCQRIRSYFEDSVCNTARQYVKETINQFLSTFPTRITLGPAGSKFTLNYDLLNAEPKVTGQFIQGYLEGEVVSRGVSNSPFHANDLSILEDQRRMISFPLSDYAFNTLFHHAHAQQFRFSAMEMLPSSSAIKNLLKLNCSSQQPQQQQPQGRRGYKNGGRAEILLGAGVSTRADCLGEIFDNVTDLQFPIDAIGDLVFKTQRPLAVFVRKPQMSYFGTNAGIVEMYGQAGADGKRELLGRVNVDVLRGDFVPAMKGCNITGSINITDLKLSAASPAPIQARVRNMNEPSVAKLAQFSTPILKEMINIFMQQYAQFPVPLIDGYECASPEFRWSDRTMQIDCDVRVMPDALRKKKTKKN